MKAILSSRQAEYEGLAAKYYEEINQASSKTAESESSSAFYKGEYSRIKDSLNAKEQELAQLSADHRKEAQQLNELLNSQR